jgi:hypothetical protein
MIDWLIVNVIELWKEVIWNFIIIEIDIGVTFDSWASEKCKHRRLD